MRPVRTPNRLPLALLASALAFAGGCGDAGSASPTTQIAVATAPRVAPTPPAPVFAPPRAVNGDELALFDAQCGACHGPTGRGDGVLAEHLDPRPRDFARAVFKLRTTTRGMPSDADLARTIRRGMPGSAMAGAPHLSDDDTDALVAVVRRLAFEGLAADLCADDDELTEDEARDIAAERVAPGPAFEVPPRSDVPLETTPARVFEFYCGECHGADGSGEGAADDHLEDDEGRHVRPRDLTREPLKGGDREEDLVRRMYLGMPGTPMPESTTRPENLWAIADHVAGIRANAPDAVPVDGVIASGAAVELPLHPLRPDGHDTYGVTVERVEDADGAALVITWNAVEATARVEVRTSGRNAAKFPWAQAAIDDDRAVAATRDGERHVARVPLDDPAAAWVALRIVESAADAETSRAAITTWHAIAAED
jgi:mono/diheme cytochrome c family protein